MGRITAEIAPGTDHPTLDSIKQRNTHVAVLISNRHICHGALRGMRLLFDVALLISNRHICHCISDSRISQRGITIKPTDNQKTRQCEVRSAVSK
jgi:hypothetical protein